LRLGAYEIEVRLTEDAIAHAGGSVESSPFGDPFAMDPFGPARPQRNPFDEPNRPSLGMPQTGAQLPHDFDPLIEPEPHESSSLGPTQAPAQVGQVPLPRDGTIPGNDLLPDDWDKDLLAGVSAVDQPATTPPEPAPHARPAVRGRRRAAVAPPNKPPKHSTGGTPSGPRRNPGRPTSANIPLSGGDDMSGALEAYLERLLKLIPAEVVSIYPVGRSLIDNDGQQGLWALICLAICVLFRARMTRGPDGRPQWVAISIAAISFMIWVYVLGSHVPGLTLPAGYRVWPALMLLVWTSVIPALYTGQRTPALSQAQPGAG
jgi:hypothetical protein